MERHVDAGVSIRRTGLFGYQDTIEPSLSEKSVPVDGHSMEKSCVNFARMKPSEYAPSAGDRASIA